MESDQPRLHFLQTAEHLFQLFPVGQPARTVVAMDGMCGLVSVGERPSAAAFLRQPGQAADGNPPGYDGEIGRQTRPTSKAAEHRGVVMENFEQDIGEQVFAVGRCQDHLPLGGGPIDDKGEQADESRDKDIPGHRLSLETGLQQFPILGGQDRRRRGGATARRAGCMRRIHRRHSQYHGTPSQASTARAPQKKRQRTRHHDRSFAQTSPIIGAAARRNQEEGPPDS